MSWFKDSKYLEERINKYEKMSYNKVNKEFKSEELKAEEIIAKVELQ